MSDEIKELRLVSRPRATVDWQCPRKRYWNYEYNGTGIVKSNTSLELFLGTTIHDSLAAIAQGVDIDSIAQTAHKQVVRSILELTENEPDAEFFALEQATLVEGLMRGFYRRVWPTLMSEYPKVVAIEKEMTYQYDDLTFIAKPDLVVADADGNLFYIEYKSTANKKDSWIASWSYAIQLHSTVRAIEATLGEKVTGVIVQGLYKGYESYGKQNSPFCYSYHRAGQPPFSQDEFLYGYKAGYKKRPVWEMNGGLKKWVDEMPEEILGDQYPRTPVIFVNDGLVDSFFNQRNWREKEIALAVHLMGNSTPEGRQEILDVTFPQKFDSCNPAFGSGCIYKELCFGHVEDPLAQGWEVRNSDHEKNWGNK